MQPPLHITFNIGASPPHRLPRLKARTVSSGLGLYKFNISTSFLKAYTGNGESVQYREIIIDMLQNYVLLKA